MLQTLTRAPLFPPQARRTARSSKQSWWRLPLQTHGQPQAWRCAAHTSPGGSHHPAVCWPLRRWATQRGHHVPHASPGRTRGMAGQNGTDGGGDQLARLLDNNRCATGAVWVNVHGTRRSVRRVPNPASQGLHANITVRWASARAASALRLSTTAAWCEALALLLFHPNWPYRAHAGSVGGMLTTVRVHAVSLPVRYVSCVLDVQEVERKDAR